MKEIKNIEKIYLEEFDVYVNPYLTYSQIQQIINAVIKFDKWSERQQNIDMLVLYHATDINKDKLDELDYDLILCSGLIDAVRGAIVNLNKINEGIAYTESTKRALAQIIKEMPKILSPLEAVMKRGKQSKQR